MDVLQVGKYYYPEVGGIEQVVQALAEGLNGPSRTVRVLAASADVTGRQEVINDVMIRKVANIGEVASTPMAPSFPARLAAAGRSADIVHYHLPNPLAVVSHLLAGPDTAQVVATYHCDIVKQAKALQLYRPLLSRFLREVDRIIVPSPALLENSEHLEPHSEKATVVPLSIDLNEYGQYDGPAHDLPINRTKPTLLFVGRLSYFKGVEYLIDAMANEDLRANLLIVGDGERRAALERRAREHGLDDEITFLGKVPEEKLKYCYQLADVFVLPSAIPSETFGIVQLEAMAYGTPVVNTDLPTGVPWVSIDGETGLTVPPRDASALAGALSRLLDDPSLRATYGKRARERVERHFTHERRFERVAALYDELCP
jgi:rhamnosyl/mannosyltransferase